MVDATQLLETLPECDADDLLQLQSELPETEDGRKARIEELEKHQKWMSENYEGCDWCCGGGDREWDMTLLELHLLGAS